MKRLRVPSALTVLTAAAAGGAVLLAGCSSSSPHRGDSTTNSPTAQSTIGPTAGGSSGGSSGGGTVTNSTPPPPPVSAPYPTPGREPDAATDQTSVLDSLPGSKSNSCAAVGSRSDVRSGTIAAGNFVTARKQFSSTVGKTEVPSVNLYVIPGNAKAMKRAVITIDPLGSGATKQVTSTSIEQADAWTYYAVTVPIPAAGDYRLTVVAGSNKGCFDVTFAK